MALVKGTNCGFVSAAPSADPNETGSVLDAYQVALKDTAPAGTNHVTAIGFYQSSATNGAAAYTAGIYSHDAVNTRPNTLLAAQSSGQSTAATTVGWYAYTGLTIDIVDATTYWVGIGMENVAGQNNVDTVASAGDQYNYDNVGGAPGYLQDPWDGGAAAHFHSLAAIYALYASAVTGNPWNAYAQQ
jgi:hypothetical protein